MKQFWSNLLHEINLTCKVCLGLIREALLESDERWWELDELTIPSSRVANHHKKRVNRKEKQEGTSVDCSEAPDLAMWPVHVELDIGNKTNNRK